MNINEIIEQIGGLTKAAKMFKVPVSTVQYWQKKNHLPAWREDMVKKKLYRLSRKKGEVTANDFYGIEEKKK